MVRGKEISKEEQDFIYYLDELKTNKVIISYERHPKIYTLVDKAKCYYVEKMKKIKEKHLFQDITYEPDFEVVWNPDYRHILFDNIGMHKNMEYDKGPLNPSQFNFLVNIDYDYALDKKYFSLIDIKGIFDRNNTGVIFGIKQKIMYSINKLYVQKVVVPTIFEKTFTPYKVRIPISRATGFAKWPCITCNAFLDTFKLNKTEQIDLL